jgi:hypothetical protein
MGSHYFFESNEKRSVKKKKKTPPVASRVTKHSERNKNNLSEGEIFL